MPRAPTCDSLTGCSLPLASLSLVVLASCGGGGGGGGGEPQPEPNDPPTLTAAPELTGGPVQWQLVLPIAGTESLTFSATDPDGDALTWQLAVSGAGQVATGLSYSSPASGPTFTVDVAAVSAPAAADVSLLVEDPNGGAAAIDIRFVRSGAPTITGVTPASAFVSAQQEATTRRWRGGVGHGAPAGSEAFSGGTTYRGALGSAPPPPGGCAPTLLG